MTRFLLDTGIASDDVNGRNAVVERAKVETARGNRVGICVPVLAELAYGIEKSASRERNMRLLHAALPHLRVWPFDKSASFEYGRLRAELHRLGRPMQSIDIMVAAIAAMLGRCTVVSKDGDLAAVPGLTVENWALPSPE